VSRIGGLIAEKRGDGVEYKPLGEIATYTRGVTYSKKDEVPGAPGLVILRSNNIDVERNTLDLTDVKLVATTVRVRNDQRLGRGDILISAASGSRAHVGKVAFVDEQTDYYFGGFMAAVRSRGQINSRFLFHVLVSRRFSEYLGSAIASTTINNLNARIIGAFLVPVPPIEAQLEIVAVLDAFTDLDAALEAELKARRRQYMYYRDALLAFTENERVRWVSMGDVGEFIRGRRFTKADVVSDGLESIHYGEIYTRYGVSAERALSRVNAKLAPTLRFAKPGDVVIAAVGETVEDVCKAVAWLGEGDVAIHDDCFAYRHSLNPKFVAYYLQTSAFHADKAKHVARAKVKRISGENLAKLKIPVPSSEEQERIVAILDKFDALLSDASIGLPAERRARRQQYEHYRDGLLRFDRVGA
jgi:type I restriction enzyme, S subunit